MAHVSSPVPLYIYREYNPSSLSHVYVNESLKTWHASPDDFREFSCSGGAMGGACAMSLTGACSRRCPPA